jgi:hypothetical protein
MADGEAFDLSYNGITQTFTVKNYPDDSGLQILAGQGHPLVADLTLLAWCNLFISGLQGNYLLSRDFIFELDLTGVDPRVKVTAKAADPKFNLTLSVQAFVSLAVLENGVAKSRHPNFKIWYELWVENASHTGFNQVLTDQFMDVDDAGEAYPNLSKTLTESLIGTDKDFERPDPALPMVQQNFKTCRRYYIRYGEVYGSVQRVKRVAKTADKWVMLGGTGKANELNYSIAANFLVAGEHKFLKQEDLQKRVSIKQSEWLSMVWLAVPAALVKMHVKTFFSVGLPVEHEVYALAGLLKYDKITYPAGATQLNLTGLYPDKIITKYEVWLVDGAAVRISEIRTYVLNYEYKEYARWFSSLSSLGCYDTFFTSGKGSSEYEISTQKAIFSRTADFKFENGETIEFDSSMELKETILTGWLSRRELKRYRDFFLSWDKFQVRNDRIYPVMLNSKTIKELKDGEHLYALEFETGYRNNEELWNEDETDVTASFSLGQFLPIISNPDPVNYDHLYWRKTQTYNSAEIDAFINGVIATETANHNAQQSLIDALQLALVGKADVNHFHDSRYVKISDFNLFADAVGAALIYKGKFDPAYTIDPTDITVLPGYKINDVVDFAGTLWRSLTGDEADPNTTIPAANPLTWEKIIYSKILFEAAAAVTLDWQAGLIPGKTYTWAQKYGNDLPGIAGSWWWNGLKWELFNGIQLVPNYTGAALMTVDITADLYPVKINIT